MGSAELLERQDQPAGLVLQGLTVIAVLQGDLVTLDRLAALVPPAVRALLEFLACLEVLAIRDRLDLRVVGALREVQATVVVQGQRGCRVDEVAPVSRVLLAGSEILEWLECEDPPVQLELLEQLERLAVLVLLDLPVSERQLLYLTSVAHTHTSV